MDNSQKPYVTQYCNLSFELHSTGITIDTASENQQKQIQELRTKALEQSGLTLTELALISRCRKYGIFTEVNTYSHRLRKLKS